MGNKESTLLNGQGNDIDKISKILILKQKGFIKLQFSSII